MFAESEMIVNAHSFHVRSPPYSMQLLSHPHNESPDLHAVAPPLRIQRRTQDISLHFDLGVCVRRFISPLPLFPSPAVVPRNFCFFFYLGKCHFSDKAAFSYIFFPFSLCILAVSAHMSLVTKLCLLFSLSVILTDCGVYVTEERNTHHRVRR